MPYPFCGRIMHGRLTWRLPTGGSPGHHAVSVGEGAGRAVGADARHPQVGELTLDCDDLVVQGKRPRARGVHRRPRIVVGPGSPAAGCNRPAASTCLRTRRADSPPGVAWATPGDAIAAIRTSPHCRRAPSSTTGRRSACRRRTSSRRNSGLRTGTAARAGRGPMGTPPCWSPKPS
jgi:hypothetical protein